MKMRYAETTQCRKHGHPEFRFSYDSDVVIAPTVDSFVRDLESEVTLGARFRPGETMQIGWLIVHISENADGTLGFLEPDMENLPIIEQHGLTNALVHMRLHKDVVESVIDPPILEFAASWHNVIICRNLGTTEGFYMDRTEPEGNYTGWFMSCDRQEHIHDEIGNLNRVSVYEAVVRHERRVLPYLLLPVGAAVLGGSSAPEVYLNDRPMPFLPGSYLEALFAGQGIA